MLESILSLPLMIAEIFAAELLFTKRLERRSMFILRFISSVVVCILVTFEILALYYVITGKMFVYDTAESLSDTIFKFVLYVAIFFFTIVGMKFCLKGSVWNIMFYCSGAYAAQHLSKNVAAMFPFFVTEAPFWSCALLEAGVCAAVYIACYFLFIRGKELPDNPRDVRRKVLLALVVLLICIGISRISVDDVSRGRIAFLAETAYAAVSCVLVLIILSNIDRAGNMRNEIDVLTGIMHSEREQYKIAKESAELINMKYHDLKHVISELKNGASGGIEKVEEALKIYGNIVKTGNAVLDVILTEKNLVCEHNRISLTCCCEENSLDFMDDADVYSLFGNAIDNAIESVGKIKDEERRSISLNVGSVLGGLSVHMENFFEGELVLKDGLPMTSKDERFHGFGLKSMQYIVSSYGGYMNVAARNERFCLDVFFPERERKPAVNA